MKVRTIVDRLRSQHHDLRQGAWYSPSEDPTWDATADAADEIEVLRAALRLAAGDAAPYAAGAAVDEYLAMARDDLARGAP